MYKKKILEDLPLLQDKGIIDESTCRRLAEYYALDSRTNTLFEKVKALALYVLGGIFITIAATLFISYNWSVFPDWIKVVLMLSPLFASFFAMKVALDKRTSLSFNILLVLSLVGLILALLSPNVIYDVGLKDVTICTALVFLFCPLAIFLRQPLGFFMSAFLLFALRENSNGASHLGEVNLSSFAYMFFSFVFFAQLFIQKPKSGYGASLNMISVLIFSLSLIAVSTGTEDKLFFILFMLLGAGVLLENYRFASIAILLFTVVVGSISSASGVDVGFELLFKDDLFLNISLFLVIIAGFSFFVLAICKRYNVVDIALLLLFMLHAILYCSLVGSENSPYMRMLLCNFSVLALFVLLFVRGVKAGSICVLNSSFAVIFFYAFVKVFDMEWSLLERGGLFLVVGVLMIVSNLIMNRKIKAIENI